MTGRSFNKFLVAEYPGQATAELFFQQIPDQIMLLLKSICLTMRRLALTERPILVSNRISTHYRCHLYFVASKHLIDNLLITR